MLIYIYAVFIAIPGMYCTSFSKLNLFVLVSTNLIISEGEFGESSQNDQFPGELWHKCVKGQMECVQQNLT
jgi:hypothetical protein